VGVPARDVEDRVVLAEEVGDAPFERLVDVLGTADEADARQPEAVAVDRRLRGLHQCGIARQAEVVVGAQAQHLAVADLHRAPLLALQDALALLEAGRPDLLELGLDSLADAFVHRGFASPGKPAIMRSGPADRQLSVARRRPRGGTRGSAVRRATRGIAP